MAIVYPLTPPALPVHSRVVWTQENACAVSTSPYTGASKVYEYDAERWSLEVAIDPLERAEAAPWIAFLAALRGRRGTFWYGDILCRQPQGSAAGSPVVNGANQAGHTLSTRGWTAGSLVLKAGDLFQVGERMYIVLADATANGSGLASLEVWPRLRVHADAAPLITTNPRCLMRLRDNAQQLIDAPQTAHFSIGFSAEEAL